MQALLDVERAGLRRLRATVSGAVARVTNTGSFLISLGAAEQEIESGVRSDLLAIRTASRIASHRTIAAELAAAGGPLLSLVGLSVADHERAAKAATTFTRKTLDVAVQRIQEQASTRSALRSAVQEQAFRLRMDATTEAAQAFSAEREEETNDYAARREDTSLAPLLVKVWDAMLDACPICRALDGDMVPWGLSFPSFQVPGSVHPRCRCIEKTLVLPIPYRHQEAA